MGPRLESAEKTIISMNQSLGSLMRSHLALISLLMSEAKNPSDKEFYVKALSQIYNDNGNQETNDQQNEMEM